MKVCVQDTTNGSIGYGGVQTIVDIPQCPAIGEMIFVDEDSGGAEIRVVLWTPYSKEYDVQVRCW